MKTLLWAKILKDNKILNDVALKVDNFKNTELMEYVKEICYKLDLETPVLLSKHYRYIVQYNVIKFTKDDFIDYIDFDSLLIEKCEE
ncbi:MAG: hypothetical protein IJW82_00905 [Clostridia bacterium]|nr:hypothetical protein [Clostridia bacterium]